MIATAGALLVAAVCPAPFSPPLDRAMTVETSEERVIADRRYSSAQTRRLLFRRDGDALIAELTLTAISIDAPELVKAAYLASESAFEGVPVRFRITEGGCAAELVDADAVAARLRAGAVAKLETRKDQGREMMARLTMHLRNADAASAGALVAEPLRSILPRRDERQPGIIAREATGPDGARRTLAGTRAVSTSAGELFLSERYAADDGPQVETSRRIDTASGLAVETLEVVRTTMGELRQTVTNRTVVSIR